ncbi:MAG: thioredoxin domain-containing protein [Patescibacteria group bacterium]|nr:thioredoxin domain-containing protein [Patescibacteria group bacterium]
MENTTENVTEIKPKSKKKINWGAIVYWAMAIILIASIFTNGFNVKNFLFQTPTDEISGKAMKFINENLLTPETTASLVSASRVKDSGLYKITIKIKEQTFDSYVTGDNKLFFPEAMDIQKVADQAKAAQVETAKAAEIPQAANPDITLYVMSFCPYGNQAEDTIAPVIKLLNGKANIKLGYVIYSDYAKNSGAKWGDFCLDEAEKYCSMHGISEVNQDIREICVQKYAPEKLWNFVDLINKGSDPQTVEEKWEGFAKTAGIDVKEITACQKSEAGALLAQEVTMNQKYGIEGSPTLLINGVIYQGDRTTEGYKQAICKSFTTAPAECQTVLENTTGTAAGSCK